MNADASALFGYVVIPALVLVAGCAGGMVVGYDSLLVIGLLIVYLLVMIGLDQRRAARFLAAVPVLLSAPRVHTPPGPEPAAPDAPHTATPDGSGWPFRRGQLSPHQTQ